MSAVSVGGESGPWSRTYPVVAVARVEGKVFDDSEVLANVTKMTPLAGVRVLIYADGGDRDSSGADDVLRFETRTDLYGKFRFRLPAPGLAWVAVDSRSIRSERLKNGRTAWAEQTFASAGGICGAYISFGRDGACFGGRNPRRSDNASSLRDAEHVIAAVAGSGDALEVAFGFSFRAVVHAGDAGAIQGSLRQFLENARAIDGADTMKFVPTEARVGPRWVVTLETPLPSIENQGTILDGRAHLAVASAPPLAGDEITAVPLELELAQTRIELPSPERSDLEIASTAKTPTLFEVSAGGTEFRRLMLIPGEVGIKVSGDGTVLLSNVQLGDSERKGSVGLDLTGNGFGRFERTHIIGFETAGVRVLASPEGNPRIETHSVLFLENTVGALIAASGSSVNNSFFLRNGVGTETGAGLRLDTFRGTSASRATIVNSTFSQNLDGLVIATGSSGNTIEGSAFLSNIAAGIRYENDNSPTPGRANKLTRNEFDENELAAIAFPAEYKISNGATGCVSSATELNEGMQPPALDVAAQRDGSALVTGSTCPDSTVEFYLTLESDTSRNNRSTAYGSKGEFRYVGTAEADAGGRFKAILTDVTSEGSLTAIATDASGNSSGFSAPGRVQDPRGQVSTRDAVRARRNQPNR